MLTITVPASSANLGLGFDCLGLALDLHLTVKLGKETADWLVDHPFGPAIPSGPDNLIIQTARLVDPDLQPHQVQVSTNIPLARGLGSSSAALVAGLVLGHALTGSKIPFEQIFQEAAALEGHPDNVAPTIFGGLQLADTTNQGVKTTALPIPKDLVAVTFIPDYQLKTVAARAALPKTIPLTTAVQQSQHLAALINACYQNDTASFLTLLEKDQLHEPYRAHLAPEFLTIRQISHDLGLNGTYLSGAGPTVVSLVKRTDADQLVKAIKAAQLNGQCLLLPIQNQGTVVTGQPDSTK